MSKRRDKSRSILADKQFEKAEQYSKKYAATVLSIISAVLLVVTVVGAILLREYIDDLEAFAQEHIVVGSIIFLVVCALQVIVAFIPGEVVEIAAGVLFGPWWGLLFCLVAETIGSVIVILLVRKFGRGLVESLYPREKLDSLPILNDSKKRNAFIFMLFAIPGTPKDFLTYLIGLTQVSIPMYILLTFFARVPSVITSTFAGSSIVDGKLQHAVIIFAVTAVISGIGYIVYHSIKNKSAKKSENNEQNSDKNQ